MSACCRVNVKMSVCGHAEFCTMFGVETQVVSSTKTAIVLCIPVNFTSILFRIKSSTIWCRACLRMHKSDMHRTPAAGLLTPHQAHKWPAFVGRTIHIMESPVCILERQIADRCRSLQVALGCPANATLQSELLCTYVSARA